MIHMRKHYIDNLRIFGILLLIPYHICMIYNGFESFYIHGQILRFCNDFILVTGIWFMPLLFLLSSSSSYFSLRKRDGYEYIKERFFKLFIPLIFGILFLIPIQTYYAERFHNNYQGNYLKQYILFFTKPTDLTGYHGGFTPGHLWFLLYLFVISVIALPIMQRMKSSSKIIEWFIHPIRLLFLFIFPFIFSVILDIAGKSLGLYFTLFILGFILYKYKGYEEILLKYRKFYLIIMILGLFIFYLSYYSFGWPTGFSFNATIFSALRHFVMWVCLLTFLGYGQRYFNHTNDLLSYLNKASYPFYLFHQSWLILISYYVFGITNTYWVQIPLIFILTVILTISTYEVVKRISITRFIFAVK